MFDISCNLISGRIPHELSMLEKLVTLDLSAKQLQWKHSIKVESYVQSQPHEAFLQSSSC